MHRLLSLALFVAAAVTAASSPAQTVSQTFPNVTNSLGQSRTTGTTFVLNSAGALVDGSGTIATAATSQTVFAANLTRTMLLCQNPISATEPLFVNLGTAAGTANGSIELSPSGTVLLIGSAAPTTSVSVYAATAGHRFVCKQQG